MKIEFKKLIVPLSTIFLFITGCKTVVTFEPGKIECNSSNVITEYIEKPDGEKIYKLDTSNQSVWDKFKIVLNNLGNIISNSELQPNIDYSIK